MLVLSGTYRLFDEMKSVHLFPGTSEGRWGRKAEGTGPRETVGLTQGRGLSLGNQAGSNVILRVQGYILECGMAVLGRQEHANVSRDGQFRGEGTAGGPESEQGMYMYPHIPTNTPHKHTGQS